MSSYLYGSYINEFGNNNHENTDILNEVTIYSNNNLYIGITPTQYNGFEKEPYFKVSWNPIGRNNSKVARISMKTGDYIVHYKTSVELPSHIVDRINAALKEKPKTIGYANYDTVWNALLAATASICNISYEELKKKFTRGCINPNSDTLKGYTILKWGK